MLVSQDIAVADQIRWGPSMDGVYSVGSGYALVRNATQPIGTDGELFKCIWKILAPEKVKMFVWLMVKGGTLTNQERVRRHFGNSSACLICDPEVEDLNHLFRTCSQARKLWDGIGGPASKPAFFDSGFASWLREYLLAKDFKGEEKEIWQGVFAHCIWWLWVWRNNRIFRGSLVLNSAAPFVLGQASLYRAAWIRRRGRLANNMLSERMVAWECPAEGWIKLNTDGSVKSSGEASAAGTCRDALGRWCGGFVINLGICSVPRAELRGVLGGLRYAWDRGFRRIKLETDSKLIVSLIRNGTTSHHPLFSLVSECQDFFRKGWTVQLSHVFREANMVADSLADFAFSFSLGFHVLTDPPVGIGTLIFYDARGRATPRVISL